MAKIKLGDDICEIPDVVMSLINKMKTELDLSRKLIDKVSGTIAPVLPLLASVMDPRTETANVMELGKTLGALKSDNLLKANFAECAALTEQYNTLRQG